MNEKMTIHFTEGKRRRGWFTCMRTLFHDSRSKVTSPSSTVISAPNRDNVTGPPFIRISSSLAVFSLKSNTIALPKSKQTFHCQYNFFQRYAFRLLKPPPTHLFDLVPLLPFLNFIQFPSQTFFLQIKF